MVKTPILVYCRIKPNNTENKNEIQDYSIVKEQDKENLIITNLQSNSFLNHKPETYNFQFLKVFDCTTSQNLLYETVAQPVVQSVLKGYNGTIFAYGQTGSGKTFTISGDQGNPGIVPRALYDIFKSIGQAEDKYDVTMSYLEIYNEHSNDLLIPVTNKKKKILLRESSDKVLQWHNLSLIPVQSYSEAIDLIAIGDSNRIVGDTPMNVFSSRSHTILTIYLVARQQDDFEIRKGKLNLVDLAGSERVHKTGEEGIVLEEARHINLSLHYLEQVIVALSDSTRTHVPYRNCTMTSALRDSLGGNCITAMIANVAIDKANIEETVSTCRFAQRVALVRNYLSVNTERDFVGENNLLREEIQHLRKQCALLQTQIKEMKNKKPKENQLTTFGAKLDAENIEQLQDNSCEGESVLSTFPSLNQTALPPSSLSGSLKNQQLQTDIIHLISWLQDELKMKNYNAGHNDYIHSSSSILSTESMELDESFDKFISTIEVNENWQKLKEEEQSLAEALSVKTTAINSLHQSILNWWRRNEKTLVQEVLAGRPLKHGTTANLTASTHPSPELNTTVDSLLSEHSDLLTDFQLLNYKLKNSRRNLQRIQRKYSIEFNEWKKNERVQSTKKCKVCTSKEKSNTNVLDSLSLSRSYSDTKHLIGDNIKDDNSNILNYTTSKNVSKEMKCNLDEKSFNSETLVSFSECDLNTTLGDLNDSIFSTSTLVSNNRTRTSESEETMYEPCQVQSEPNDLYTKYSSSQTIPFRLTGDPEIDGVIIDFYKNKYLN